MTNKVGMNLLLWGTEMDSSLFPVLEQIKEAGYDGVEVPIFNTDPRHWEPWRIKLDALGLERVAVTLNGPGHQQISPEPPVQQATLERNKQALDCAHVLGARLLTGPYHSALGVFSGTAATKEELQRARKNLYLLAEHASRLDITLGLEYLNRFESYLVTSSDELISLVDEIGHPNCKLMFDSFHANIEEKNLGDAVRRMGDRLAHVQLSENDRATLGAGHIDFPSILKALQEIGYQGMISVEAFGTNLSAANIWRKMFVSETQLMQDSIRYLNSLRSAERPSPLLNPHH
jgi:D-psicose/D-tagatose/L-ribulose 3-epimerase